MTPKSFVICVGAIDTNVLTRNGDMRATTSFVSVSPRREVSAKRCSFAVDFFEGARIYPSRSSSHQVIGLLSVYAIFSSRYMGAALQHSIRACAVVRSQYRNACADT